MAMVYETPSTECRKLVVIGLGSQGKKHADAARQLHHDHQLELVATCDPNSRGLLGFQHFGSFDSLLRTVSFDTAIIAVPNNLHFQICQKLLAVGVNVLKEKPLACSLAEAETLVSIAKPGQLRVFQQRYFKAAWIDFIRAVPLVGDVESFWYRFSLQDFQHSWYWDITQAGGGVWLNMGWHAVTMTRRVLGDISDCEVVCNVGGRQDWEYQTEHSALADVALKSGAVGKIFVSAVHDRSEVFRITGRKATLEFSDSGVWLYRSGEKERISKIDDQDVGDDDPYLNQLRAYLLSQQSAEDISFDFQTLATLLYASEYPPLASSSTQQLNRKDICLT